MRKRFLGYGYIIGTVTGIGFGLMARGPNAYSLTILLLPAMFVVAILFFSILTVEDDILEAERKAAR